MFLIPQLTSQNYVANYEAVRIAATVSLKNIYLIAFSFLNNKNHQLSLHNRMKSGKSTFLEHGTYFDKLEAGKKTARKGYDMMIKCVGCRNSRSHRDWIVVGRARRYLSGARGSVPAPGIGHLIFELPLHSFRYAFLAFIFKFSDFRIYFQLIGGGSTQYSALPSPKLPLILASINLLNTDKRQYY